MKPILTLLLLIAHYSGFAQTDTPIIVGHSGHRYFVLKVDDHYIVEELILLRNVQVIYDTLVKAGDAPGVFRGNTYSLMLADGETLIAYNKRAVLNGSTKKRHWLTLKAMDAEAIKERDSKRNYFYYEPYVTKMAEHSLLLSKQDKAACTKFDNDRTEMYKKAAELSIPDFKQYLDAFVEQYGLQL